MDINCVKYPFQVCWSAAGAGVSTFRLAQTLPEGGRAQSMEDVERLALYSSPFESLALITRNELSVFSFVEGLRAR